MRQYFILGLVILGLVSCVTSSPLTKKDTNQTIQQKDSNKTKKVVTIDLDKELKKDDYSKGGLREDEKTIPIYIGNSDEIALLGEILKQAVEVKIKHKKIGDNDEVAYREDKYVIATDKLKDGDIIVIKYGDGKEVKLVVRAYWECF